MSDLTEGTHPRVFETISEVVELEADDQTALATERMVALVAEFPREGLAHAYLAWVLSRSGRYREAIEHGKVAVQLAPRSERVSLLFFRVLWGAGESLQAFDEMKRFMAIGHSEEYLSVMRELEQTGE